MAAYSVTINSKPHYFSPKAYVKSSQFTNHAKFRCSKTLIRTCMNVTPITKASRGAGSKKLSSSVIFPLSTKKYHCVKTLVTACSIDVAAMAASSIRPRRIGFANSDKLPSDVRKRVMDAIDSSERRVTVGDVMIKSGLKLDEVQQALQALAADTNGLFQISDKGDVLYVLSEDYRSKLAAKSFCMRNGSLWQERKAVALNLTGAAMLVPFLLGRIVLYPIGFLCGFQPGDVVIEKCKDTKESPTEEYSHPFLSFLFGEEDPNQRMEEERWKMIGHYIASKGGVVTAEELLPYLDVEITENMVDSDSYIQPVLLQFSGQVDVDEEGDILYRFPLLQRTAIPQNGWADWVGEVKMLFTEKKWEFRCMGSSLFGSAFKICAGSLFAIPFIRWIMIEIKNVKILKRNQVREWFARAPASPDLYLSRKLSSARNMAERTCIGEDKIVYSRVVDLYDDDETRE